MSRHCAPGISSEGAGATSVDIKNRIRSEFLSQWLDGH
jgi:hypothetical protein